MTNFGMINLFLIGMLEQLQEEEYHIYDSGLAEIIGWNYRHATVKTLNFREVIEKLRERFQILKENQE